jgi:integrase
LTLALVQTIIPQDRSKLLGGICMKGSIGYAKHVKRYFVAWYHEPDKKTYKIYRYKGELLYHEKMAEKLLACMQGDMEKGVFRIEQYTKSACDVIPYLQTWVESVKGTLSPATYKDYKNSIENHLVPFFETKGIQLHEIQYDTLMELLSHIDRDGKGKLNVMYCLHTCLDYAWRSHRIPAIPPFPKKKAYNIVEPTIQWLSEERQIRVIEAIHLEHQPIFWWLKLTLRRPSEAMALLKEDFDGKAFTVRRGFSDKQPYDRTKTGETHIVPLLAEFEHFVAVEADKQKQYGIVSPYFFVHPEGKKEGKHYTHKSMGDIWKAACKKVGETIDLYSGLKHSSASQLINEYGYNIHDVQIAGDWARLDSVKKYAKVEVSARKAILEKKVLQFKRSGTPLERKSQDKPE